MSLESLAALNDLAAGQWGLLTTRQAARQGISRVQLARLVDAGVLERVGQGIYSTTSTNDRFQALHAAWLSLDPNSTAEERLSTRRDDVVASHTSAAALFEMGDLPSDVPELNTVVRKQTVRPMKLHRLPLAPDDVTLVDGLPTTTPERTIADLIRSGHDLSHVADATGDGVRSGVLDRRKLCAQLDRVASRTGHADGIGLLEKLLDLAGFGVAAAANSKLGRSIADSAVQQYRAALANLLGSVTPEIKDLVQYSDAAGLNEFAAIVQSARQSLDVSGFPAAQAAAVQTFSSMLSKDFGNEDLIRSYAANALAAGNYAAAAKQQLDAARLPAVQAAALQNISSMLPPEFASDISLDAFPFLQVAWAQQSDPRNQPSATASNEKSKPRKTKDGS